MLRSVFGRLSERDWENSSFQIGQSHRLKDKAPLFLGVDGKTASVINRWFGENPSNPS